VGVVEALRMELTLMMVVPYWVDFDAAAIAIAAAHKRNLAMMYQSKSHDRNFGLVQSLIVR